MKQFMQNNGKRMASFLLVFALMITPVEAKKSLTEEEYAKLFQQVMERISSDYIEDIDREKLFEAAMKGMFESLDEYSDFFTKEESKKFEQNINRDFVGIGIEFRKEKGKFTVQNLFDGGSAKEKGIQVGDHLHKVNGELLQESWSAEEIASRILGETGTEVEVTVLRSGREITFRLERRRIRRLTAKEFSLKDRITLPSAFPEKEVVAVQIDSFASETSAEFSEILEKHFDKKVLILDLRNNGGGYVQTVIDIANMIVPKGKVVTFRDRRNHTFDYESDLKRPPFKKIFVLVNKDTASASEILSAALQDSGIGIVVGEQTFGKGVAQEVLSVGNNFSFKLTFREFYSPKGKSIHKEGVKPDLHLPTPEFLEVSNRFFLGDSDEEVYRIEKILEFLGYFQGNPDTKYESDTLKAVSKFQKDYKLGQTKVLDFTTQNTLNRALLTELSKNDRVLKKAVEETQKFILTDGK